MSFHHLQFSPFSARNLSVPLIERFLRLQLCLMAPTSEKEENTKEDTTKLLEEQYLGLEDRFKIISCKMELCKGEFLRSTKVLQKSVEEKTVVTVNWRRISALCNQLKSELSSYGPDFQNYMESLIKWNESLRAISKQNEQSEEAKLINRIVNLHRKNLDLSRKLIEAELDVEWLSSKNRLLEAKYKEHLLSVGRFGGENSAISSTNPEPEEV